MLLADAGEDELLELLAEIAVIVAYLHEVVLDDVGHNHFVLVRLSTYIV